MADPMMPNTDDVDWVDDPDRAQDDLLTAERALGNGAIAVFLAVLGVAAGIGTFLLARSHILG